MFDHSERALLGCWNRWALCTVLTTRPYAMIPGELHREAINRHQHNRESLMNQRKLWGRALATGLALLFVIGAPAAMAEKYDGVTVTFDKSITDVQKAAVDALTTVGAPPSKQEPNFVEGSARIRLE